MLAGERVVLLDFGLFVPEVELGRELYVGGTAPYVAPELLAGSVELGTLVDLYALGVIAFEMLVGKPPLLIDGEESPGTLLRRLRAETPPELASLVCELLERDPRKRPASAEVVVFHLASLRARRARVRAGELRVLIVDDDPAISKAFRRWLGSSVGRLTIEFETDPLRALARIDRDPPDIVLVDLQMPQMNGMEMIMALRGLPGAKRPFVVGMSAEASGSDVALLGSLGVQTFLPKDARFANRFASVIEQVRLSA